MIRGEHVNAFLGTVLEALADELAEKTAERLGEKSVYQPTRWVSIKEAAEHLGVGYDKFAADIRAGHIPSHTICGKRKIDLAELDERAKRDLL